MVSTLHGINLDAMPLHKIQARMAHYTRLQESNGYNVGLMSENAPLQPNSKGWCVSHKWTVNGYRYDLH